MKYNTKQQNVFPINITHKKGKYFSKFVCPDMFFCNISFKNNSWLVDDKKEILSRIKSKDNSDFFVDYSNISKNNHFIILLESPHIKEFNSKGTAIGPAHGWTGYNIYWFFEKHLKNSFLNLQENNYRVVVINAVQFQASLGLRPINKTIRNQTWRELFDKGDINNRLLAFAAKSGDCIVVNCCTKDLRQDLNDKISAIKGIKIYQGNHPSRWFFAHDKTFWK